MGSVTRRRLGLALLAPAVALVFSIVVSAAALALSGNDPVEALSSMLEFGTRERSIVDIVNDALPLYLSGLAVAVGFKMALFNIGVEGQYALAALLAAAAGAAVDLPAVIHVALVIAVAMAVGAGWAGLAGALKVTRGVHEVISTIMLNFIATGLGAYLLVNYLQDDVEGSLNLRTPELPKSARFPELNGLFDSLGFELDGRLDGFLLVAMLAGLAYYVLVWRLRFGYDLRASGLNPWAAQASGVHPRGMVVRTMLISGAIAGLVGLAPLMGFFHRYTLDFPTGLGFSGIAVALIGRNHPVGIAVGALLFSFLEKSSQILDLEGIPKEIVVILQGTIIISVVVAYEIVRRWALAQEAAAAARASGDPTGDTGEPVPA